MPQTRTSWKTKTLVLLEPVATEKEIDSTGRAGPWDDYMAMAGRMIEIGVRWLKDLWPSNEECDSHLLKNRAEAQ